MLAVAAHDLGLFVKYGGDKSKQWAFVPTERKLIYCRTVTDLGGKTRVMELMTDSDADTRYQALMTTQLLMSQFV